MQSEEDVQGTRPQGGSILVEQIKGCRWAQLNQMINVMQENKTGMSREDRPEREGHLNSV